MQLIGRYHDGATARARPVAITADAGAARPDLVLRDPESGAIVDRWPSDAVFPVAGRRDELRLGLEGRPYGLRLVLSDAQAMQTLQQGLPALARHRRKGRWREIRTLGAAMAALAGVFAAYVFGVPLLSGQLVWLVPQQWETQLGETAKVQIAQLMGAEGGFTICDPDPESLANRAISRFAKAAMAGSGSPFSPDVTVVRSDIPNAFALPGGHAYYFSALLEKTDSPDEFAGVMAHELGHVVHRHGMEGLIATSATGLLVGFALGDMTGLSIAGGIGAALIDTRFSREAEHEADSYAASTGARLGFAPAALASLLERVAADDETSEVLALLSSHPLTADRRLYLESLPGPPEGAEPVFSAAEWQAIKTMCRGRAPLVPTAILGRGTSGLTGRS